VQSTETTGLSVISYETHRDSEGDSEKEERERREREREGRKPVE
jgi:hypothetical protein